MLIKNKITALCIFMVMSFHGARTTKALHRNIISDTYTYDTLISLMVNDTTEYIMDFTEDHKEWQVFPTRVHVSTNNSVDSDYPLFVTATQQKGVSSWQLPLIVSTSAGTLRYTNMATTLCPYNEHNVTSSPPSLHISTSHPRGVSADIKLRRVTDFQLPVNEEVKLNAAPGTPKYYYFSFQQSPWNITDSYTSRFNITIPKSVIVTIESPDDVCAAISIQNNSCPVFVNEKDLTYQGYYFTMTRKGGIILTESMFPTGFYVVFVVKERDDSCFPEQPPANQTTDRIKKFSFRVSATISYGEYVRGAALLFSIVLAVAAMSVALLVVGSYMLPRVITVEVSASAQDDLDVLLNQEMPQDIPQNIPDRCEQDWPVTMASLCTVPVVVHEERSHRYFWTVLTVSIVYALPVVQLLASYQKMIFSGGDRDVCYYNYLCARPLGPLADSNHVYSNIGYVVLGGIFMIITRRRQLQARQRPPDVGVRQHFGILYSLGLALIMEGVLSACYHFCPNKMNFQFDSSFMYLLGALSAVCVHAARRPDLAPHAHTTALALAAAIALGVGTVVRAWRALRSRGVRAATPRHRARAALLTLALAGNIALALYGLLEYKIDFAHHLLAIILCNSALYCALYLVLKLVHGERVAYHAWAALLLAGMFWALALSYFRDSTTKWSQSPSVSRTHARTCSWLGVFDQHDAWHAASAAALYLSLLTLLTADDALQHTPHTHIPVF